MLWVALLQTPRFLNTCFHADFPLTEVFELGTSKGFCAACPNTMSGLKGGTQVSKDSKRARSIIRECVLSADMFLWMFLRFYMVVGASPLCH